MGCSLYFSAASLGFYFPRSAKSMSSKFVFQMPKFNFHFLSFILWVHAFFFFFFNSFSMDIVRFGDGEEVIYVSYLLIFIGSSLTLSFMLFFYSHVGEAYYWLRSPAASLSHGIILKSEALEGDRFLFKQWLCQLLPLWSWERHFISPSLNFLTSK